MIDKRHLTDDEILTADQNNPAGTAPEGREGDLAATADRNNPAGAVGHDADGVDGGDADGTDGSGGGGLRG
ncbi:hypothetical protein [Tessaracoccus massiliensis]|uniref:hypothetical protein n=1 Tax=Tessaracoccus massiliensis TaxID=1522311 RepID=UPI0005915BD7|nr:hypothetical protein [Tessaracoccus massiliensis]